MSVLADGYAVFPPQAGVLRWANEARKRAEKITSDPVHQANWLRHDKTWFVGVDALDNDPDGSVGGAPLTGPWEPHISRPEQWHPAQVSAVYQGYPGRDTTDIDAADAFRRNRFSAHLDGLLPVGPDRRRMLKEPHGFILGLPLNAAAPGASPLVVYEGSHHVIREAFQRIFKGLPVGDYANTDLTEAYQAARRRVFEQCIPRKLPLLPGQSVLVHRMAIHGIAPWETGAWGPQEGRIMAYFRPILPDPARWLSDG